VIFSEKKLSPGGSRGFAVFAGFLKGVLEKVGYMTWYFGGENVVKSMVKRGGKTPYFGDEKYTTFLNFIFRLFSFRERTAATV